MRALSFIYKIPISAARGAIDYDLKSINTFV